MYHNQMKWSQEVEETCLNTVPCMCDGNPDSNGFDFSDFRDSFCLNVVTSPKSKSSASLRWTRLPPKLSSTKDKEEAIWRRLHDALSTASPPVSALREIQDRFTGRSSINLVTSRLRRFLNATSCSVSQLNSSLSLQSTHHVLEPRTQHLKTSTLQLNIDSPERATIGSSSHCEPTLHSTDFSWQPWMRSAAPVSGATIIVTTSYDVSLTHRIVSFRHLPNRKSDPINPSFKDGAARHRRSPLVSRSDAVQCIGVVRNESKRGRKVEKETGDNSSTLNTKADSPTRSDEIRTSESSCLRETTLSAL